MAILRNIQNNNLYKYLGENRYRNLLTGVEGEINEEVARKIFKINVEMTVLCAEYPIIEETIKALQLRMDKPLNDTGSR